MGLPNWLGSWPVIRQLQQGDILGLGRAAQSPRSAAMEPRTATADRVIATRAANWQDREGDKIYRRTLGFASLGGATLDNEENYLIKKLFTALGAIQIENQARI